MKQTHEIVREAHKQRQQRRLDRQTTEGDFDGVKAARQASKVVAKADRAMIVDVYDIDIFEQSLATAMLAHLEPSPMMQLAASKTAFEILRDVNYKPSLTKQMLVGSQAHAVELVIERVLMAAEEVIRHRSMLRHEDFPAMCDASQVADSDALREHFEAERLSGARAVHSKPWLFGKGMGSRRRSARVWPRRRGSRSGAPRPRPRPASPRSGLPVPFLVTTNTGRR